MDECIVNLSLEPLLHNASINCVTVDGCGVDNLFCMNGPQRKKGMCVERFIRPPVSLSLIFKIPLRITHVLIRSQLDYNEIYKVGLSANHGGNNVTKRRDLCGIVTSNRHSPLLVLYNKLHYSTAIHYSKTTTLRPDSEVLLPNKVIGSLLCAKLVVDHQNSLQPIHVSTTNNSIRSITINFLHWSGPKPLSIESLEIWGTIDHHRASNEDRKIYENYKKLINEITAHGSTAKDLVPIQSLYNTLPSINREEDGKEEKISALVKSALISKEGVPQEFIDSITCDLMTLPVLLPSGHYVDQSTVDKASELDLMCGRSPCDPYTGVSYTTTNSPKFCPKLKAAIDQYIISNEDSLEVINNGRTLGSAYDIIQHQTSMQNKVISPLIQFVGLQRKTVMKQQINSKGQEDEQPVKKRKEYSVSTCAYNIMSDYMTGN